MVSKHTAPVSKRSCNKSACDQFERKEAATVNAESSETGATLYITSYWKRTVEIIILSFSLLLVWSIFAIPTIIYALPPEKSKSGNDTATSINITHSCLDERNSSNLGLNTSNGLSTSETTCTEGFYLENANSHSPVCTPHCESWLTVVADDIILAVCMIMGMIFSAILFSLVWLQKETIMVFPTYYLLYACINLDLVAPFLIVGSLGKAQVLCSSESLIQSYEKSTTFCIISGIMNYYGIFQGLLLVSFHALGLCWSIVFPFHYRRFKLEGRIKYIHAISIVHVLVVPAISPLLHLIGGYRISPSPLETCVGGSMLITYFATILPISILMATATSVLVIFFWRILKEFILKKQRRNDPKVYIWSAEAKIFVIMCYYIAMGSVTLCVYAYFLTTADETAEAFQTYFLCQSVGMVPGWDCGDPPNARLHVFNILESASYFLQGLFPIIVLIFVVNCSKSRLCQKFHKNTLPNSKFRSHALSEQSVP